MSSLVVAAIIPTLRLGDEGVLASGTQRVLDRSPAPPRPWLGRCGRGRRPRPHLPSRERTVSLEVELVDVVRREDEGRAEQNLAAGDLELAELAGRQLSRAGLELAVDEHAHGVD